MLSKPQCHMICRLISKMKNNEKDSDVVGKQNGRRQMCAIGHQKSYS